MPHKPIVAGSQPLFIADIHLFRRLLNERLLALNARSKSLRVPIPWLES